MKSLLSICILTVSLNVFASAANDCFEMAKNDPQVFSHHKDLNTPVDGLAMDLCRGTSDANAPIECYKESIGNPNFFPNLIEGNQLNREIDGVAFCHTPF